MLTIILIAGFAGFLLGLSFKVFVLIPSSGMALFVTAAASYSRGLGWILAAMAIAAVSIQLGYLAGAVSRSLVAHVRSVVRPPARQSMEHIRGAVHR